MIYAAATLYNLKLKFEPSGDKELFLMMNSAMQAVTKQKINGGFDKYAQQSVRRFSIPWKYLANYLTPFIEGHKRNYHKPTQSCPKNCTNLVKQKNSAQINNYFLSRVGKKEI